VQFQGWLINAFVMGILVPGFHVPISHIYYYQAYLGILVNIASAINFVPLYAFSQDHRKAFQEILAPIFPCITAQKTQQVTFFDRTKSAFSTPA
jgi:Na+-transporting NADH:ubiquinone oxidoreductase subunit NqrB